MKTSGQRQDVAFLALAVAVLAVAVALFVAMRSMDKSRKKQPEPEPVAEVETAEPVVEEPAATDAGRDPFKAQAGSTATAGPAAKSHGLKLVGLVAEQGDQPMAIIRSGTKRYYPHVGDRAGGYTLVEIGSNTATLEKDGDRVTLVLNEPEPDE